jgi:hypothetical protein
MLPTPHTTEEVARIAEDLYRRDIRPKVMPQHKGKFLVLDIESGDYEIDADDWKAEAAVRARRPDGVLSLRRIGYTTPYKLGGALEEEA